MLWENIIANAAQGECLPHRLYPGNLILLIRMSSPLVRSGFDYRDRQLQGGGIIIDNNGLIRRI